MLQPDPIVWFLELCVLLPLASLPAALAVRAAARRSGDARLGLANAYAYALVGALFVLAVLHLLETLGRFTPVDFTGRNVGYLVFVGVVLGGAAQAALFARGLSNEEGERIGWKQGCLVAFANVCTFHVARYVFAIAVYGIAFHVF